MSAQDAAWAPLSASEEGHSLPDATAPAFLADYGTVVDSWLVARLVTDHRFAAHIVRPPPPILRAHEEILRVGHILLVRAGSGETYGDPVLESPPTPWPRLYMEFMPPAPLPTARPTAVRDELIKLRASYAELVDRAALADSLETKVTQTAAEAGLRLSSETALLPKTFAAQVRNRLSSAEKSLFQIHFGNRKLTGVGLQQALLDLMDGQGQADLCHRISVYEDEVVNHLPPAAPTAGKRTNAVRALGWGDLLVVRERLDGYAASEISYIENVLSGESRKREHEHTLSQEDVFERERTTSSDTTRDLQTSQRNELQSQVQQTVAQSLSLNATVNTSGKYGPVQVDTSLGLGLTRSDEEARLRSVTFAQEVIAKSVERIQETTRELQRRTTTEVTRELNTHVLANDPEVAGGVASNRSSAYLWVEKKQELQLRLIGVRLMLEFFVPEPALSLLTGDAPLRPQVRKPAPFTLQASDITAVNYQCLGSKYQAAELKAPPPKYLQTGFAWASEVDNSGNQVDSEDTVKGFIQIPPGYAPLTGVVSATGRGETNNIGEIDPIQIYVAVAGQVVLKSPVGAAATASYDNIGFAVGATSALPSPGPTPVDGEGLPVTIRVAGHDDKTATANISILCKRTTAIFANWQQQIYQQLLDAHRVLVQTYEQSQNTAGRSLAELAAVNIRPSAANRVAEKTELRKWCVKLLATDPFSFDTVRESLDGYTTIDADAADAMAPVSRFFEDCFEWANMSYVLYPYFWARQATWSVRSDIKVPNDPQYEAFLKAGAARVIVPVTPGSEDRVLAFLETSPTMPDSERIPGIVQPPHPENTQYPDLWLELVLSRNEEASRGVGSLHVVNGSAHVMVAAGTWAPTARDIGRALFIDGDTYGIAAVDASGNTFELDRPYQGATNPSAAYATGSVAVGQPWTVNLPTSLVVVSNVPIGNRIDGA